VIAATQTKMTKTTGPVWQEKAIARTKMSSKRVPIHNIKVK
jgi:hypothetical protein